MGIRRLTYGDIREGETVAWDVYGENGSLLVRKGHRIANEAQVESLVARGFIEDLSMPSENAPKAAEPVSALRLLTQATGHLAPILQGIANGASNVRPLLEDIASLIIKAVEVSDEVAAASVLHNQRSGPYRVRHCVDTAVVALIAARAVKRSEEETRSMVLAALTMNVGMYNVPEEGELSEADQAVVRSHPNTGSALLRQAGIDDELWLRCVQAHHENEDGSGYPAGLKGDEIPAPAKMLALADRYCARVADRAKRRAMLPNLALRDILLEARQGLDAQLSAVLIRELGVYPIGTFVRLLNGEIGVVWRRGSNSTTPRVLSLIGPRGAPLDPFLQRDTRVEMTSIRDVLSAEQARIELRMEAAWGRAAAP